MAQHDRLGVRAVVFDMDGLMLDTEPIYKTSWQAASAELGYVLDDAFYARFAGRRAEDCERDMVEQFGAAFPLDRFRARWPPLWKADVTAHGLRRKPGLLELLDFLDTHGVPLAVATSTDADFAALCLRSAGLDGRFRVVVTGDEIAHGKPAPDIYLEAARRLQAEPTQCLALEDSEAGILAASRAGMVSLLIPDGVPPSPAATSAAFRVLRSLTEAQEAIRELIRKENGRR